MSRRPPLPAGVWVLGFVSLLMDISSEMVHSLLPLFLVGALGVSVLAVGLIEGVAEAAALVVRVFSGALSDWWGRRKGLAVLGYALGALSKPVFALAETVGPVAGARFADRVGKGIRGAPRDALLADRVDRRLLLGAGLLVLVAADLVMAWAAGWALLLAGVALWGIHMGLTQGLLAAMVADSAPAHLRGTAFGLFNLAGGLAMLLASALAGALWTWLGPAATFPAGAAFALAALGALGALGALAVISVVRRSG